MGLARRWMGLGRFRRRTRDGLTHRCCRAADTTATAIRLIATVTAILLLATATGTAILLMATPIVALILAPIIRAIGTAAIIPIAAHIMGTPNIEPYR